MALDGAALRPLELDPLALDPVAVVDRHVRKAPREVAELIAGLLAAVEFFGQGLQLSIIKHGARAGMRRR